MPLSNLEKAKYGIVIDRERAILLKNKEYRTQRSLAILSAVVGVSLSAIDVLSGAIFIAVALFFGFRWRSMEQACTDAEEKIQRYQHFLDLESD